MTRRAERRLEELRAVLSRLLPDADDARVLSEIVALRWEIRRLERRLSR
jgi:hypothetical protein